MFRSWWRHPRATKPNQCSSVSGLFIGYRCDLDKEHPGRKHEALISKTVTDGFETERRVVYWE